jgi:hypothetical protein
MVSGTGSDWANGKLVLDYEAFVVAYEESSLSFCSIFVDVISFLFV